MIQIVQKQAVRGYQIPTFGMRELKHGELVKEESKLGKSLLKYFPSICKIIEDEAPQEENTESVIDPVMDDIKDEGVKPELLIEEPEDCATVEEVFEVEEEEEEEGPQDITVEEKLEGFTDKVELDEWAEKEFSIKLSRAKSLKNMKKDFLAQYSK